MTILYRFLNLSKIFSSNLYQKSCKSVVKELEVPSFCDVYITVPYNIEIKPLNIHKYHNCDKLIIEHDGRSDEELECNVNGNHVTITDKTEDATITCNVKVPVKANLYVNGKKDITVGQLNGDKIRINSEGGNVVVDKFNGECIKITTKNGNINFKDVVQASKINVYTENGSITTGRLQGLDLKLETNNGNMSVDSSYCKKSIFEVKKGNMELANIHKTCRILLNEGQLKLNGFDGKLSTSIENGSADIYLSRITGNSDITITQGSLNLKLAELCQEQVKFSVTAKEYNFADEFKPIERDSGGYFEINSDINEQSVSVNCSNGSVSVDCASWEDMIKMKIKK